LDTVSPKSLQVVIGRVSLGSFDPEAMEEAIQKSHFEHYLDGPGQFRGTILQATNARTRLDWGRYNLPVLARGPFPADRMTLGVLLNEREESLFNGSVLSPGSMMLYGEGEELNVRLPPNSNWLSIQLDRSSLAEIGIECSDSGFRCWDTGAGRALRGQILRNVKFLESASQQTRWADALAANQAINDVEDYVLLTLSRFVAAKRVFSSQSSTRSKDRTLQIVRDATNYMEANIEFPITISEICLALNTNIKALERAFLRTYGLGPKQYLLKNRLSKLRQLLICGPDSEHALVDAYLSCGLSHFGRAAQGYQAFFGEPPSLTLSRSRS
jgi:AraC family ethanolamine operon transcriptional activator